MNPLAALATAIVSAIVAAISSLTAYFGRKALVTAASIALFVGLTGTFFVTLKALYDSLNTYTTIPAWVSTALAEVLPGDFWQVLSAILAARAARAAYDIAMDKVKLIASAN